MTEPRAKRMTLDEIFEEIETFAKDPDAGADKFRALKMLAGMEIGASNAIPPPMEPREITDHLIRLMKPAGSDLCRNAYIAAFPRSKSNLDRPYRIKLNESAADLGIDMNDMPRTLKQLYKRYPEVKRGGFPPGFPVGRGPMIQQEWCRQQGFKIERERKQAEIDASFEHDKEVRNADTIAPDVAAATATGHQAEPVTPME